MYQSPLLGIVMGLALILVPGLLYVRAISRMLSKEREFTKSPFSEKLLRPPGESLRVKIEEIRDDINEHTTVLALTIIAPGLFCVMISQQPLFHVVIYSLIAGVIGFIFCRRSWQKLKLLRSNLINYRLGFDGERYVAAELAPLISQGYRIFHDFVFDMSPGGETTTFNIDHIAVGADGVFVIKTKAKRKSTSKSTNELDRHEISVEGTSVENTTLRFPNGTTDDKPIKQALRQAQQFKRWLDKSGIPKVEVRPIVVFPGWMIKSEHWKKLGVQSARKLSLRLPALGRGRKLSPIEVQQIAARIEDKCRNIEGAK